MKMRSYIFKNYPVNIVVLVLYLFSCSSFASADIDPLEKYTGTHTRVVWIQEQGSGADTFGFGKNFKLMGYDSRDGKKERYLLPETENFYKPILTPDGKKVVVSSRSRHQIFLVDFKKGKRKSLGKGVAVDVWQDPSTGKVWVYALAGKGPESKYLTTRPLIRFPLNKPEKRELIWNKTHLSWSNFDLSRDGKFAGGLFPWPDAGILIFEEKTWKRYGKGCWTALSPDNSAILWIFDGLHRNLNFVDPSTAESWTTNINNAPGIDGFEVYHPRWSNHVQYLTMTGPYVEGEGGNKIKGGGGKVEIYVGKFSEDLKSVESWFQVSHNDRADFYPDVWLANGSRSKFQASLTAKETKLVANSDQATDWPAGREQLIFVWQDVLAENQLADSSPLGFNQLKVTPGQRARFNRFLEMDFNGAGFTASWPADKALAAIKKNKGFGIEFLFTPAAISAASDGPVVRLRDRKGRDFFRLSQKGNDLNLEVSTGKKSSVRYELAAILKKYRPEHLFFSFQERKLKVYVNGRLLKDESFSKDPFSAWTDGELVFGRVEKAGSGVYGALSHVALYDTVPTEQMIMKNSHLVTGALEARPDIDTIRFKGKLIEPSSVPSPDSLGAYRRALVVNRYQIIGQSSKGNYKEKEILVAQWAVLDRTLLPETKGFTVGATVDMRVEKFDQHPELEGERLMMDMFDPDLELYYQVGSQILK